MESVKNKITSTVTGDAYDKPAKTEAGAFTTQDSSDAATLEGTSADPNHPVNASGDKAEQGVNQGLNGIEKKEGLPVNQNVNSKVDKELASELK